MCYFSISHDGSFCFHFVLFLFSRMEEPIRYVGYSLMCAIDMSFFVMILANCNLYKPYSTNDRRH